MTLRWMPLAALLLLAASLQFGQASAKSSPNNGSFKKEEEKTTDVKSEADLKEKESGDKFHEVNRDSELMEKQANLLRSIQRIVQTTTKDLNQIFAQNVAQIVSGEISNQGTNQEKRRRPPPPPPPFPLLVKDDPDPASETLKPPPPPSLLQLLFPALPPSPAQPNLLEALFPTPPPLPVSKLNSRKSAVASQEKQGSAPATPPTPPRPLFQLFRPPPPQTPPPPSFLYNFFFPTTPPPPPPPLISLQLGKKD